MLNSTEIHHLKGFALYSCLIMALLLILREVAPISISAHILYSPAAIAFALLLPETNGTRVRVLSFTWSFSIIVYFWHLALISSLDLRDMGSFADFLILVPSFIALCFFCRYVSRLLYPLFWDKHNFRLVPARVMR